ncbi:hypothetical protein ACJX0J_025076, partial [Zea mays]
ELTILCCFGITQYSIYATLDIVPGMFTLEKPEIWVVAIAILERKIIPGKAGDLLQGTMQYMKDDDDSGTEMPLPNDISFGIGIFEVSIYAMQSWFMFTKFFGMHIYNITRIIKFTFQIHQCVVILLCRNLNLGIFMINSEILKCESCGSKTFFLVAITSLTINNKCLPITVKPLGYSSVFNMQRSQKGPQQEEGKMICFFIIHLKYWVEIKHILQDNISN